MEYFHSQEYVAKASSDIYDAQHESSLVEIFKVGSLNVATKLTAETAKSVAACKNHSEAERRRRKRINGHLSTLRTLLPSTIKTDKASLLAEVVRRVKELKEATSELATATAATPNHDNNNNYINTSDDHRNDDEYMMVPSEADELHLFYCDQYFGTIKAVVCCEERPELVSDIIRALNSVQARVVRAEMATIGGRTKLVLWLLHGSRESDEGLTAMRRALVMAMGSARGVLSESSQDLPGSKRIRRSHC